MQYSVIKNLCCPVCHGEFNIEVFEESDKNYNGEIRKEIESGILTSDCGYIFPIVKSVPRMQLESFNEFCDFIAKYKNDFNSRSKDIFQKYGYLIDLGIKKHRKVKNSFGMEWSIFNYEKDKTWVFDREGRKERFLKETGLNPSGLIGKMCVDVGCGNGVLTSAISELGANSFGIDVSSSIERAYENNQNPNVHYFQADLQNLPFRQGIFDLVYSAGVIHHTNNTELSFSCISEYVKPGGKIFIWLYHPIDDLKHHVLNYMRAFTNKLPLLVQYYLYLIFLVPQALIKLRLKGVKRTWREQLINFFDVLSPEFRFEHTPAEAEIWFLKRGFSKPTVTINEYYGFGLHGDKK